MAASVLRAVALMLSALVALSFALFALDQARSASRSSENAVAGISASDQAGQYAPGPGPPSTARQFIDAGADAVLSPFSELGVRSSNPWADRGLRALLGLVLYGCGLAFLARWTAGRAGEPNRAQRPRPPGPYVA